MTQDKQASSPSDLMEQYKLYVEMADRVTARRADANKFYISLLTGLLALLSVVIEKNLLANIQNVLFLIVAVLGLSICYVWIVNIRSYSQLNSSKFSVIHEMEQQLPFQCYSREWELLSRGKEGQRYLQLTQVEKWVPFAIAIPYMTLLVYSLYRILGK